MNYYIQGNKENADQIKAAFEKLGINVLDFGFADKTVVYCSIGGCVVQYLPYSINLMNILYSHPDYKELELPVEPKFKVGDWVVKKDGTPFYGGNYAEQITNIEDDGGLKCIWFSSGTWLRDKDIRLWTIQDAKDGDVLSSIRGCPFIYDKYSNQRNNLLYYYAGIDGDGDFVMKCPERMVFHFGPTSNASPATKEQRDLLFKKMKEAGYQWDTDKKELHKIQPHYDIANFKPFDKVLVRDSCTASWNISLFGCMGNGDFVKKFRCLNAHWFQCIPFNDDTEHLLGTTDMPSEEYINW